MIKSTKWKPPVSQVKFLVKKIHVFWSTLMIYGPSLQIWTFDCSQHILLQTLHKGKRTQSETDPDYVPGFENEPRKIKKETKQSKNNFSDDENFEEQFSDTEVNNGKGEFEDISETSKSRVWTHFLLNRIESLAKCKLCSALLKVIKGSTKGLHEHLSRKHGVEAGSSIAKPKL